MLKYAEVFDTNTLTLELAVVEEYCPSVKPISLDDSMLDGITKLK